MTIPTWISTEDWLVGKVDIPVEGTWFNFSLWNSDLDPSKLNSGNNLEGEKFLHTELPLE